MEDYLSCIGTIDDNVGILLDYLESSGLSENTIVVYTSDQGFFLGEHGLFDKRYMYEESLRTPLVIRYPDRIAPGGICQELVQNLDMAPTFLNLAGVDIPDDMQGQSLHTLFGSTAHPAWRDAIYYQFFESGWGVPQHYGIRTRNHKLIHFLSEPDNWELYDLEHDPGEMVNLYGDPASETLVQDLKSRLKELQEYYQVPAPQ
jgi:arylsulfatase A-like enzyme